MNSMENWAIAYLINALWQIPLLFAGAWLAARLAARISPRAEHRIWVCALLAQIVLPACPYTAIQLWSMLKGLFSWGAADSAGQIRVVISPAAATASSSLHLPPLALAALLTVCAIGVCYSAARLVWGLGKTLRILREATPLRLEGELADCWSQARQNFAARFRRSAFVPRIAVSGRIAGPVTAGSRTLLLPDGFLAGLPEAEFSALLAHEFAHIERRDFAKNLCLWRRLAPHRVASRNRLDPCAPCGKPRAHLRRHGSRSRFRPRTLRPQPAAPCLHPVHRRALRRHACPGHLRFQQS